MRPVLQYFVIALLVVSQPLNRKITEFFMCVSLRLNSYFEYEFMKIIPGFLLMMGKQCDN